MTFFDKTLVTSNPSITSRLTAVAAKYGIPLTEQKLLEIIYKKASLYECMAGELSDTKIITIMGSAGLFDNPVCGAYKLKRKKSGAWAILNENNKEILVGSGERILKALEQHLSEVHKRTEAKKKAEQAAKWAELNNAMAVIKGKDAWI